MQYQFKGCLSVPLAQACVFGWVLGCACQLQQTELWPWPWVWASLAVAMGLACAALGLRRMAQRSEMGAIFHALVCLLAALLLSLASVNARCQLQALDRLSPELEGRDLQVQGVVASLPLRNSTGLRFRLKVLSASLDGQAVKVPPLVDLGWYQREAAGPMEGMPFDSLSAGDHWQFTLRLKAPHGSLNPRGFDAELWMWEQGVMASGSVRNGPRDAVPVRLQSSWQYPVAQLRQGVRERIYRQLRATGPASLQESAHNAAGVIAALVMGDQAAIERSDWDVFRATGVAHLMSISGLHITLFAFVAGALIGWLWRLTARWGLPLCLRIPSAYASLLGGVLLATLYALFSGWGLPAQRTVIMLAVVGVLRLTGNRWPWPWVWGLALFGVVLADPWALLQAGFWLSFVAVGVLFATDMGQRTNVDDSQTNLVRKTKMHQMSLGVFTTLKGLLREQWVVTLALTPLSMLFFGQVSVVGLLANLLAIPWVTWVVTPLAMAGVVWAPLWTVAASALQPLASLLAWMASWPGASLSVPMPPVSLAMAAIVGGAIVVMRWPWSLRSLGLPLMLPALLWQVPKPVPGQFDLWAADIGQGNAVLVRTAKHALLYDAGPQYSAESDAGQRVLVPLLSQFGARLDRVLLSHRDMDHTGGAPAVLASQAQADLWSSLEQGHRLEALRSVTRCHAGQRWEWDGVRFEILHPDLTEYGPQAHSNALSCVLRIDNGQQSALLVGDIEAAQEAKLVRNGLQRADILLVPHHGSKTSSTPDFLDAISPRWALLQAGYRNRYGHPAAQVMARYEARAIAVIASVPCGAAHWQSAMPSQVDCERVLQRRYWHHRPP